MCTCTCIAWLYCSCVCSRGCFTTMLILLITAMAGPKPTPPECQTPRAPLTAAWVSATTAWVVTLTIRLSQPIEKLRLPPKIEVHIKITHLRFTVHVTCNSIVAYIINPSSDKSLPCYVCLVRNPFTEQRYLVAAVSRGLLLMQWFQPHQIFKHVMVQIH